MDTKQLKQKILDLAIRGKLVPQDPNDEPASVLLERIRKEKEQLIASGKLKKSKSKTTDTPHYKNVPFEIPDNWEWTRLSDVCQIVGRIGFRGYTKSDLVESNGAITLSPSNIVDGKMEYSKCTYISWEKYEESPEIQIQNGDILLVKTGSSYGKCALVENLPQKATINPQFVTLKHIAIKAAFLTYILQSDYARTNYDNFVLGTAIPTFTQVALGNMFIPLAPQNEQIRILQEIDRLFALIDEIEANKHDLQEYIKQAKSKVLDLAIHGKLVLQDPNDEPAIDLLKRINPSFKPCDTSHYENLPDGWVVTPMQKICDLAEGEKQTGIDRIYLDVKYLRGKGERVIAQNGKYVPAGSTMILVDGENSGEIFTTPVEGYQGSTFKLLDILDEMYKPFILYVIKSYQKQFRENKVGSAIPHLNKKLFREIEVFVPPFEEQKRIVKRINEIFETIDKITAEL